MSAEWSAPGAGSMFEGFEQSMIDIVPTGEAFRRADLAFGLSYWLWFFLAQPFDLPERVLGANAQMFLDYMLDGWSGTADAFPEEVRAEYARAFRDPRTLHAICEEYRAAAALDYEHDEADRGRRRIRCPVLALWSRQRPLHGGYY